MSANILTSEERLELSQIPLDISQLDLIRFFTISQDDLFSLDFERILSIGSIRPLTFASCVGWAGPLWR